MSGVYIKDMDMPTRCGRCDMCFKTPIATYTCCITGANIDNLGEMMEDCPLVPIPPNVRLIDANALPYENMGFMLTDPDEWGLKLSDIDAAPTIIQGEAF